MRTEEERLKTMTAKEKEEFKKVATRLTGKRLLSYSVRVVIPSLSRASTL